MTKYIMKDVITNPEDPRLKDAIGKRVYCGNEVSKLLKNANSNYCVETLTQIEDVDFEPFTTKDEYGDPSDWNCIIIVKKDEQKPKYVPFESIEEFMTAYFKSVANSEYIQKSISITGIWLKHNDAFLLVVEIWDRGVVIGDCNMKTIKMGEDNYLTTNSIIDWHKLYEEYTFLDGSPCGKEDSE